MDPDRPGQQVRPRAEMVDIGSCRFCQDPVWAKPASLVHEGAPAHPCCEIHARENPGQPCIACAASKRLQRREHDTTQPRPYAGDRANAVPAGTDGGCRPRFSSS
jgi:hypothetical protein